MGSRVFVMWFWLPMASDPFTPRGVVSEDLNVLPARGKACDQTLESDPPSHQSRIDLRTGGSEQ